MAETSAHLVDSVLPKHPYRQFVISLPYPLRYWLNANRKLLKTVHQIIIKEVQGYYVQQALRKGVKDPIPGCISFTQRFGSDLRLNPHFHILSLDGVFTLVNERPLFKQQSAITDKEVEEMIAAISSRVRKHLTKKGYLSSEGEMVENPLVDPLFSDHDSINQAVISSISNRIAFGPNAGHYVTKIGSGFGYGEEIPLAKGKRCYSLHGFSLHANTAVNSLARDKLESLVRYISRGPLSNDRLEIVGDKVKLELKSPYTDGTTHLLFTYGEFIEKLTALVPPPRTHLVSWHGCFAPNSPIRRKIVLKPEVSKGFQFDRQDDEKDGLVKNYKWAKLLARTFKIDVSRCSCGGELKIVTAIRDSWGVKRYLEHLGLDSDPPQFSAARCHLGELVFEDQGSLNEEEFPTITYE